MQHFLRAVGFPHSIEAIDINIAGVWGDKSEESIEKDQNRRDWMCRICNYAPGYDVYTRQI